MHTLSVKIRIPQRLLSLLFHAKHTSWHPSQGIESRRVRYSIVCEWSERKFRGRRDVSEGESSVLRCDRSRDKEKTKSTTIKGPF